MVSRNGIFFGLSSAYLCLSASFTGIQDIDEPLKAAPLSRPDDDLVRGTIVSH